MRNTSLPAGNTPQEEQSGQMWASHIESERSGDAGYGSDDDHII